LFDISLFLTHGEQKESPEVVCVVIFSFLSFLGGGSNYDLTMSTRVRLFACPEVYFFQRVKSFGYVSVSIFLLHFAAVVPQLLLERHTHMKQCNFMSLPPESLKEREETAAFAKKKKSWEHLS